MRISFFLLLFIVSLLSCNSYSQDTVDFNNHYLPEHIYKQTITQKSHSEKTYIANKEILDRLAEKGIKNPSITESELEFTGVTKTGKETNENKFPLVLEVINSNNSSGQKIFPDGFKVYAQASKTTTIPSVDSISANGLNEEYKKSLFSVIQNIFSQINFPEKKLKIGDQFTKEMPLKIPFGGTTTEITATTTYKLVRINKDSAFFNTSEVFTMNTDVSNKSTVNTSGSGNGTFVYDINNNFFLHDELNITMEMKFTFDNYDMKVKSNSKTIQSVNISTQ